MNLPETLIAQLLAHEDFCGVIVQETAFAKPVEIACSPQLSDSDRVGLLFGALTAKAGQQSAQYSSTIP